MSGVLVVAEHRRGEVREVTFELISLALELKAAGAGPVAVLAVGREAPALAGALAVEGVDAVLAAPADVEGFEPHVTQRAVEQVLGQRAPVVVLAGHTVDGAGFAPAVAAAGALGFASNVLSAAWLDGALTARRGAYGDRLVAELAFDERPALLMVRTGAYPAAAPSGSAPPVDVLELDDASGPTIHLGFREADTSGVDITKSEFLLSIGRGIGEQDQIERFEHLADRLGATLSASRPLVDAGWMDSARQVGQSGRTVKPKVYLALGISGAVQHLAGIRDAETIIAVNTDADAPIFGVAHYGAVADVHDLADALEAI